MIADACPRPAFGRKTLNVLLFGERQAPQDHQWDGDQGQNRRHQASDGGHCVVVSRDREPWRSTGGEWWALAFSR